MIWTLKNGERVVLQNFVYSHNDCTSEKIAYWAKYIRKVWKEEGTAKCCYEVKSMGKIAGRKHHAQL